MEAIQYVDEYLKEIDEESMVQPDLMIVPLTLVPAVSTTVLVQPVTTPALPEAFAPGFVLESDTFIYDQKFVEHVDFRVIQTKDGGIYRGMVDD